MCHSESKLQHHQAAVAVMKPAPEILVVMIASTMVGMPVVAMVIQIHLVQETEPVMAT